MSRALLVVAAVLTVVAAVVVARAGELMGGRDGASSTGLLASEVRLAPEIIGGPTAQDVPAVKILGDAVDCPPSGAGSEDTQQRFEQLGSAIGVTGMLSSFDAVSVVVNGPGGEVTATLAADFELRGDLSPGSVVDLEGTAEDGAISAHRLQSSCADAGVVDCATGDDPHFELRIEGTSFKVTGRLDSITSQQLRILGPGLIVELSRTRGRRSMAASALATRLWLRVTFKMGGSCTHWWWRCVVRGPLLRRRRQVPGRPPKRSGPSPLRLARSANAPGREGR